MHLVRHHEEQVGFEGVPGSAKLNLMVSTANMNMCAVLMERYVLFIHVLLDVSYLGYVEALSMLLPSLSQYDMV